MNDTHQIAASRSEAMQRGDSRYFSGVACKNGHVAIRHVKGGCVACQSKRATEWAAANQDRREASTKRWREENRDKISAAFQAWSAANPGAWAEQCREWRERNPESARAAGKRWRAKNPDKERAKQQRRLAENPEGVRASKRRWKQANPDRVTAYENKRRAAKMQATPPWLALAQRAEIDGIYLFSATLQRLSGVGYHVDHVVPLIGRNVCGLHVPWNLRAIPASENYAKANRLDLD